MVCYLDIDGVLADFTTAAQQYHGIYEDRFYRNGDKTDLTWDWWKNDLRKPLTDEDFWGPLGYGFWSTLSVTPLAYKVLELAKTSFSDVVLLSSPCMTDGCLEGKRDWVANYFPTMTSKLFLGKSKHLLASPNKVLIDDSQHNVDAFLAEGGQAILYPASYNTNKHFAYTDSHMSYLIGCIEDITYR